jgi:PIN domain nuclease of toxin-antitoxin system
MISVMDASALIAYVRDEPGGQDVEDLLLDPSNTCYVHAINLCEVYYDHLKVALRVPIPLATAMTTASAEIADLQRAGLIRRDDIDELFWMEAGGYKAQSLLFGQSVEGKYAIWEQAEGAVSTSAAFLAEDRQRGGGEASALNGCTSAATPSRTRCAARRSRRIRDCRRTDRRRRYRMPRCPG